MKIKYGLQIYIYLFLLIALFSASLILLFSNREKRLKKEVIETELTVYVELINKYLQTTYPQEEQFTHIDSLAPFLPKEIRVSIFDDDVSSIIYDNIAPKEDWEKINNSNNIGVIRALLYGSGNYIRQDEYHDGKDYYFYAIHKNNYIIRIGLPYIPIDLFQKSYLILFSLSALLFLLILGVVSLLYLGTRRSLKKLKLFVSSFVKDNKSPQYESFLDDELRDIQSMIANVCKQLESKEKNTQTEKEKLLEHFNFAEEGISFFTADNKNIYTNVHFIQYLSILLNETTFDVHGIFENPLFSDINHFLANRETKKSYSSKLYGNGKIFGVHVIIFDDKSYEIIIHQITDTERKEMDAAAITNNIAHELRTPVTSMRGYLETILEHENMSEEKRKDFLEKAYRQCVRLSEIIQDVVLLSKTTYAPQYFLVENIDLYKLVVEITEDLQEKIEANNSSVKIRISENVTIKGNRTLLTSIFRNLVTNSLKYAGIGTTIVINNYITDENYFYFSFSDNGRGVEEKHIDQLFDRFYRASDGRTRDSGGSGLGLSIVKDAVQFHQGEVYVKNRPEGGLEFIFTLRKN
jgi:Signal transduction histidine kinase